MTAISVCLACLTTAISLTSIFSEYLRKYLCKEKIEKQAALLATIVITILFTNLGFNGISAFLSPILQIIYPGLILLTVMNLSHLLFGLRSVKFPVFCLFALSVIFFFYF